MYELIEHKKLDTAAASITFSNIPQIYTDLVLLVTARNSANVGAATLTFNTSGGTYSRRRLYGSGSQVYSDTGATDFEIGYSTFTASTFSSASIYIPNYRSSVAKSYSSDSVSENNGTEAYQMLIAGLWSGTDAINSITLKTYLDSGNFVQHTSATLYGINRTQALGRSPQAMGGYINYANGYWYHTFTGSGNFVPFNAVAAEYLVVAGGGGGSAGGGGAGGLQASSATISAGSYPVVVGSGGAGSTGAGSGFGTDGTNGGNSSFNGLTSTGGGGGAHWAGNALSGGSGGGGGNRGGDGGGEGGLGGSGISGQGYPGGSTTEGGVEDAGSGGGGAGGPGQGGTNLAKGGNGGSGLPWLNGEYYAGGGGGGGRIDGALTGGTGGLGGGGNGAPTSGATPGLTNTGGGGGGGGYSQPVNQYYNGAAGGSGVVIVRYRAD